MGDRSVVKGWRPMGCGETLVLGGGGGGGGVCSLPKCACPTAAGDILEDREVEHVVDFGPKSFSVQHPLRERLKGDLFQCSLYQKIATLSGPPVAPGRYRATVTASGRVRWESL